MNPLTREWVDKAEEDYYDARLLRQRRKYDTAGFHAQQCAEKYMKAVLQDAGVPPERTHQLSELLADLIQVNPMWDTLREATEALKDFAVRVRYPGMRTDAAMVSIAVGACDLVRNALRQYLGLRVTIRRSTKRKTVGRKKR
jgi:HEPN domain-containing protein